MDDLISHCVQEIALDGEQGTTLQRLWGFAHDFQVAQASSEEIPAELDQGLKKRIWKHLVKREEIMLKADNQVRQSSEVGVQDLQSLSERYSDSLNLFASEDKQWLSITGLPKNALPIPNLQFKLLSCISQARSVGVTQSEAARITKQDPRSFPARTKLLVENGLITKTPILVNGNMTYRLTHSRYAPVSTTTFSTTTSSVPVAATSTQLIEPSNAAAAASNTTPSVTPPGFSRDHTIGNQIRQAIGETEWNKQQLYDTLKADHYKVPIELFLEKATLPKPVPLPRTYGPQKVKDVMKASSPDVEQSSTPSKRKRAAKPKSNQTGSTIDQPALNTTADANYIVLDEEPTTQAEPSKDNEIKAPSTSKRKSSAKDTPVSKRQKTAQPPGVGKTEPPPEDPATIERKTVLLSLIKENDGVLELVPRLDLMYAAHVDKLFPHAQSRVDAKLITRGLDALEARHEVVRIILHAETSTGPMQYKFIFTLPEVDPVTNPKILELRDQLNREAGSYKPALINGPPKKEVRKGERRPVTTIEAIPTTPIPPVARRRRTTTETVPSASKTPIFAPIPSPSVTTVTPKTRVQAPKKPGRPSNQSKQLAVIRTPNRLVELDLDSQSSDDEEEGGPTKRRRLIFKPEEDKILYQGTALLNKYFGGHGTPWVMFKKLLPDRKDATIRRRSSLLETKMKNEIRQFLDSFENRYTEARQRGTVREMKTGQGFDLKYYLDWYKSSEPEDTGERESLPRAKYPVLLPKDVADFERYYEIESMAKPKNPWYAEYAKKEGSSSVRRHEAIYREPVLLPTTSTEDSQPNGADQNLESLIKATILTPEEQHDKDKARQAMAAFGSDAIARTMESLLDNKLLTRIKSDRERLVPGRNYKMSDKWDVTVRGQVGDFLFDQAQSYREFLAGAFKEDGEVLVSEFNNDGSIYCILSLLASQEAVLRPIVPEVLGNLPSASYKGRAVDVERLGFDMVLSRTNEFSPNSLLSPSSKPPPKEDGEYQTWVSTEGTVLQSTLDLLKRMVLAFVHNRPSITKEEIVASSGGVLTLRECEVLLLSLKEDGLVEDNIPGIEMAGSLVSDKHPNFGSISKLNGVAKIVSNEGMDLEQFTSENFNPLTYLNQLLPPSNPDTYYASATSLLPSLELLARNTHSDLTSSLSTLLRTSTRLGIDMDTLTHDTRTLAAQIPKVQDDVSGLQLESGVMSELALLEVVQERMQQTLDVVTKAGQWTTQVDEGIRFQIESGAYEAAELRISELRELLGVWEGTVEFQDRAERIVVLERALVNAKTPVSPQNTYTAGGQRGTTRPQSRLRVDSSDAVLRDTGGIFGQFRQNIGR